MTSTKSEAEAWIHLLTQQSSAPSLPEVQATLADLVQGHPYLPANLQAETAAALFKSPLSQSTETSELWAETCYGLGGSRSHDVLQAHADGSAGSTQSHERAALYTMLLRLEGALSTQRPQDAIPLTENQALLLPHADPLTIEVIEQHFVNASPNATVQDLKESAGIAPVLASDCDGTTWSGDIGEEFFEAAIQDSWFEPQSLPLFEAFTSRLDLPRPSSPTEAARLLETLHASGELVELGEKKGIPKNDLLFELYELQGRAYVGKSIHEIKARTRAIFEAGMASQVFTEIQRLFELTRAHGILPIAVSASCQWQVEIGASYLGVPPRLCLGVRSKVEDGIIGDSMNLPMTYGPGKVDALRTLSPCRPLFAIGDSWQRTDREMLKDAAIGLVVVHQDPAPMDGLRAFHIPKA